MRSTQALIQTMGRAARHSDGHVIMYADKITSSMKLALSETKRRRQKQQAYNQAHNLKPQTIIKKLQADRLAGGKLATDVVPVGKELKINKLPKEEIKFILRDLTNQMNLAAENLEFEKAANLRDRIKEIEVLAKPVHRSSRRRQIGNLKCKN